MDWSNRDTIGKSASTNHRIKPTPIGMLLLEISLGSSKSISGGAAIGTPISHVWMYVC